MSKEREWGTWLGVWRTLAIGLDGARTIGIRESDEPLRMLKPNFDEEKRQVLYPSAKGSFRDSTI